jgi:hypothetical protein
MGVRDEIQKRIDRKRSEIGEFEAKAREAAIYIQALEDALRLVPKDPLDESAVSMELRPGSRVAKAREFLRKLGRPGQILEILTGIGEDPTAANRAALSGSIGAYVRKGEIFTRPAPNTFGLIEFGVLETKNGPPPGFGKDEDAEREGGFRPGEDIG